MNKSNRIITFLVGFLALVFFGCGKNPEITEKHTYSTRYRDHNVVILVLDTLRADHLGCYGYFRKTSPRIDKLSTQSVVFENAFASIPITLPSHVSILTGLYPQSAGLIYNYGYLSDRTKTLAKVLRQAGYKTGAVVSTAVLKNSKNLNQGFDVYYHNFGLEQSKNQEAWEVKGIAEDANRLALDWLAGLGRDKKFFLFINYYDIHAPYIEQEGFNNLFDPAAPAFINYLKREWTAMPEPSWKRKIITFYDRSIAYTDHFVGRLWDKLEELGLRDRTIIMITSDHGNGLYQHHDYWSHGKYLYDEQIRIPLLLLLPGEEKCRKISRIVETIDIFPTILDLLGIEIPSQIDGSSTVPLLERKDYHKPNRAYAMRKPDDNSGNLLPRQFCLRMPEDKLISTIGGEQEFYDLKNDPFEKMNIYSRLEKEKGKFISELTSEGEKWLDIKELEKLKPGNPDQETLKELRSLGYIR